MGPARSALGRDRLLLLLLDYCYYHYYYYYYYSSSYSYYCYYYCAKRPRSWSPAGSIGRADVSEPAKGVLRPRGT